MQHRDDCLQKEQLKAWFDGVKKQSPQMAAYLQGLLFTGARRGELMALTWDQIDFQWNSIEIHGKVEGTRIIPLTPYLAQVLHALARRNQWVFSSPTSKSGRTEEPHRPHNNALKIAGIPYLSQRHNLQKYCCCSTKFPDAGKAVIVFDPKSETCNIVSKDALGPDIIK